MFKGKDVLKTGLSHVLPLETIPSRDPIVYDLAGKELEENLVKSRCVCLHFPESSMVKQPMTKFAALLKS